MSARPSGHMFVVRGDVTALAIDAVLVPSGLERDPETGREGSRFGHVENEAWDVLLGNAVGAGRFITPAPGPEERVVRIGDIEGGPAVWAGHTGQSQQEPAWYAAAAERFVVSAGEDGPRLDARPLGNARPLVAVPLLGVGLGGMEDRKGEVVQAWVEGIASAMGRVDVDVALVLHDAQAFAAAQQARSRVFGDGAWNGLESHRQTAADLARRARAGELVLFVGAGASMGAGAPSWHGLLKRLAERTSLSADERTTLVEKLDTRDAGQILSGLMGTEALREAVAEFTTIARPSLVHQLLASLPADHVVTTNYDDGLERSFHAAGRPLTVLFEPGVTRWLLKLHGSGECPASIVLSRDDYLRWEEHGSALGAIVQALLLTRHLLFVGYGLGDDNVHRLMHSVRAALGGREARVGEAMLATVVSASPRGLADRVWEDDLRFVRVAGADTLDAHAAARFIDFVVALTAAPAAHLLDPAYADMFNPDELAFGEALRRAVGASRAPGVPDAVRDALAEALLPLGLELRH